MKFAEAYVFVFQPLGGGDVRFEVFAGEQEPQKRATLPAQGESYDDFKSAD